MATNPTLKSFRERARSIILCACDGVVSTALAATITEGRLWLGMNPNGAPKGSPRFFTMIQGRIEQGDSILFAVHVHGQREPFWAKTRRSALPIGGVVSAEVATEGLQIPRTGKYDLVVRVNGRLTGKAILEALA